MNTFKTGWTNVKKTSALDLGYRYQLPRIRCDHCGRTWGDGYYEYPAIKCNFFNDEEFAFKRVVNGVEFEAIKNRIINFTRSPLMLVPGGSIGELAGEAITTDLDDFAWGRICYPQISRRACEMLASDGIGLVTTEMSLRCRGKKVDSHLALQIEPVALLTEENLKQYTITHCVTCGDYTQVTPHRHVAGGYKLQRALWPPGRHLVTLAETLDVIASPEFIESVKKHRLTGIRFQECGEFV